MVVLVSVSSIMSGSTETAIKSDLPNAPSMHCSREKDAPRKTAMGLLVRAKFAVMELEYLLIAEDHHFLGWVPKTM